MSEESYWARMGRKRVGRRAFLGGAGTAGLGAATLALVGCGDDDDDDGDDDDVTTGSPTVITTPSDATEEPDETADGAPSPAAGEPQTGGIAVLNNAIDTVDSFDANRAVFGPMHYIFSMTMGRLVEYKDMAGSNLDGDLAESAPEQPDDLTYIFTLREGVKWHNKPPLNGRDFTVDDVVYYVERQKEGKDKAGNDDPGYWRKSAFQLIEQVEAVDERTVTFRTSSPNVLLLSETLPGPWSHVVAREAVEAFTDEEWKQFDARTIIGTGAFTIDDFKHAERAVFTKNPEYYEPGIPYMDGVRLVNTFGDPATGESAFRQKQIDDWSAQTVSAAEGVTGDNPDAILEEYGFPYPVVAYGITVAPPWNDVRALNAIGYAFDRNRVIQQLHSGKGRSSPIGVPWTFEDWAIPQDELLQLPGYREDKTEDIAEARKLWAAAGGPDRLTITLPDIWVASFPSTPEVVPAMYQENLGIEAVPEVKSYVEIVNAIFAGEPLFGFGWTNPPDVPDPTGLFYKGFHSTGAGNIVGVNKPGGLVIEGLDALLEKSIITFDREERIQVVKDIQTMLNENGGGGVPVWYNYINQYIRWAYLEGGPYIGLVAFGQNIRWKWLNQTHASYQGRPTPS